MATKKRVYLSPSDQSKNSYAYGNTTEAIQCGKIAEALKKALERNGIEVKIGQYDSMANRCAASDAFGADLHVPIHSNACNGKVSGTRMFCYNKTGNGYKACRYIFNRLAPLTPGTSECITANGDEFFEVREPAAPTAYIEVDFHDVPSVAKWIINHTTDIAEAICKGICEYFGIVYQAKSSAATKVNVPVRILKRGMSGNDCQMLKVMLHAKGYLKIDPLKNKGFGEYTEAAVKAFQKKAGLTQSGVADKNTLTALLKK